MHLLRTPIIVCWFSLSVAACVRVSPQDGRPKDSSVSDDSEVEDTETDSVDSDTSTPDTDDPPAPVHYRLRRLVERDLVGLSRPLSVFTSDSDGFTYVIPDPEGQTRTSTLLISDTYFQPQGTFCKSNNVLTTVSDASACGGSTLVPGRIDHAIAPARACLDLAGGRAFFLSTTRARFEVVDIALEGDSPYTYHNPNSTLRLPPALSESRLYGPCAYLPATDEILLSPTDEKAGKLGLMLTSDGSTSREIPFVGHPTRIFLSEDGRDLYLDDASRGAILRLDAITLEAEAEFVWDRFLDDFTVDTRSGRIYLSDGHAEVAVLDLSAEAPVAVPIKGIEGAPRHLGAHRGAELLWVVSETESGGFVVQLVQDGAVTSSESVGATVAAVSTPGLMGDLVVVTQEKTGADARFLVYEARADGPGDRGPLYVYLFTTIEAPDDAGMAYPCDSPTSSNDFTQVLNLVTGNAEVLASLGVPVAMAVGDNFGQKSEACGETDFYDYLAGLGFDLGALIHNRPCYSCTNQDVDGVTYNADYCVPTDPDWKRASAATACFPNDPEYCDKGDWECYRDFLTPRVDYADRWIPGGANFLVGADRHGMWNYDWLRLYQEVERISQGRVGFDLTMFGSAWAYNNIAYDDSRGKNPAPWRAEDRSGAWTPGDIQHWDQDSHYSDVLYLPGISSSTVKLGEQQQTGLYMLDLLALQGRSIAYDAEDYEANFQLLRQALTFRDPERVSTFYFHIHDAGVVNLADATGAEVLIDDGSGTRIPVSTFLRDFIARIDEDYVSTGEVVWMAPSEIRALWTDPR
jgi:hypothetical protein